MRVAELKALARECGLRGYSQMRKAEIIERIRNGPHGPGSAQQTITNRAGLLIYLRGPTKLNWLGLDLIVQDSPGSLHIAWGQGHLLNKKWIYLNNRR